jgi:hypothetical protein
MPTWARPAGTQARRRNIRCAQDPDVIRGTLFVLRRRFDAVRHLLS